MEILNIPEEQFYTQALVVHSASVSWQRETRNNSLSTISVRARITSGMTSSSPLAFMAGYNRLRHIPPPAVPEDVVQATVPKYII